VREGPRFSITTEREEGERRRGEKEGGGEWKRDRRERERMPGGEDARGRESSGGERDHGSV
jgi:hypothetical protein